MADENIGDRDDARTQWSETLLRIKAETKLMGSSLNNPIGTMKKMRFTEDELRNLVRLVSSILASKHHITTEQLQKSNELSGIGGSISWDPVAEGLAPAPVVEVKVQRPFFNVSEVVESNAHEIEAWESMSFEDFLRCNVYLRYLTFQQISALEDAMSLDRLSFGEVIAEVGDTIAVGIIRSGRVAVLCKNQETGEEHVSRYLESGDTFGYESKENIDEEGAREAAVARCIYRISSSEASIYFCSLAVFNEILYMEQDVITNWISKGLDLWCRSIFTAAALHPSTADWHERTFLSNTLTQWQKAVPQLEVLLTNNGSEKDMLLTGMEVMSSVIHPDVGLRDNLENVLRTIRQILDCDRVFLFACDPDNQEEVFLFGVHADQQADESIGEGNVTFGFRMRVGGVVGHVIQSRQPINLSDATRNEYFDAAVDVPRALIHGEYLVKELLCVPITNAANQVVGVLHCLNSGAGDCFRLLDEMLALYTVSLMRPILLHAAIRQLCVKPNEAEEQPKLKRKSSASVPTTASSSLDITFQRLLTVADHRHVKCTCRLIEFGHDLALLRISGMFSTQLYNHPELDFEDLKIANLSSFVAQFPKVSIARLTPSTYLLVEFYSKNNHPCGWTLVPFYDAQRHLLQGQQRLPIFYGQCPPDWLIIGNLFTTAQTLGLYYQSSATTSQDDDNDEAEDHETLILSSDMCSGSLLLTLPMVNANQGGIVYYESLLDGRQGVDYQAWQRNQLKSSLGDNSVPSSENSPYLSVPDWLLSLHLPEVKRRALAAALSPHQMVWSSADSLAAGKASTTQHVQQVHQQMLGPVLDTETQLFITQHGQVIQTHLPELLPFLAFTFHENTNSNSNAASNVPTWLLSSLMQWRQLQPAHLLPLLDVRFNGSAFQTFAVSSLWTLPTNHLQHLIGLLATIANAHSNVDGALHRFLLQRIFSSSSSSMSTFHWALSYLWHIQGHSFFHASVGMKDTLLIQSSLSVLCTTWRQRLAQGHLFLSDLHQVYVEMVNRGLLNQVLKHNPTMDATHQQKQQQSAVQILLREFQATLDNLWTGEKAFILPISSQPSTSLQAADFSIIATANEDKEASVGLLTKVDEIRLGTYFGRDSFVFFCRGDEALRSSSTRPAFIYLPHVNYRLEQVQSQAIHLMNFLILQQQPHRGGAPIEAPFTLWQSEIYPLFYDRVGSQCKEAIASYHPGTVSMQYLLLEAMNAHRAQHASNNKSTTGRNASPSRGMFSAMRSLSSMHIGVKEPKDKETHDSELTKIPDDLLLQFYRQSASSAGPQQDLDPVLDNFVSSLAGYILVSHVLSFTCVTAAHLFLDQHGTFFVKNPTSVFGVDAAVYLGASSETHDPKSKTTNKRHPHTSSPPLFLPPCFLETIGGTSHARYQRLQALVNTAYTTLRRHASCLLWFLRTTMLAQELPLDAVKGALWSLRESLALDVTEDLARQQLWESVQRSIKLDYQLKMAPSTNPAGK